MTNIAAQGPSSLPIAYTGIPILALRQCSDLLHNILEAELDVCSLQLWMN